MPVPGWPGVTGGVVPLEKLIAAPPDYLLVSSLAPPAEDQGSSLLAHPALAARFPPERRIALPERLTVCGGPSASGCPRLARQRGTAGQAVISLAHLWMLFAALVADAAIGDPDLIWRRLPHPIAAIGAAIAFLDRRLNRPTFPGWVKRAVGGLAVVVLVALTGAVGYGLERLFQQIPYGAAGTILVAAILLAGRSLHDHVSAVASAFAAGGLPAARSAVSRIVGRDPAALDEAGVSRAAIESTAENFSDAVVAPALWFAIAGLPGLLAYKAINTANSMIGHLTPRHQDFGWAAARLDDLVNWPMSRLAGALSPLRRRPCAGRRGLHSAS